MKFLYYLGTQAIFKKYHSDLDPKLRDPSVTFSQGNIRTRISVDQTYEGFPFPNNDFAMSMYNKLYGKNKSNEKFPSVTCPPMQSANMVTKKIGVTIQHAEASISLQTMCGMYAQTIEIALTSDNHPQIKNMSSRI
jgi:hypothetical protein